MHLRSPSMDKGFTSFLWALVFFLFLFFGMLAIEIPRGKAFIFAALIGFGVFFYVRIYGDERAR